MFDEDKQNKHSMYLTRINMAYCEFESPLQKIKLHIPTLEEVASVLQDGLAKNFAEVQVTVKECPDLTQKPFMLADKGLCGNTRVTDVGGPPFLAPTVKTNKIYNLKAIGELSELPNALLVGAGAGPHHVEGVNCEMMSNIKVSDDGTVNNQTHICKVNQETSGYILKKSPTTDFCLMANLFISEGKPGKVLEIKTGKRTGPENFMTCIRNVLASHYGSEPVALGGAFVVQKGKVKTHVMPKFSECPLNSDEDVNKWLHFYEMNAPFTCLGYLVSHDPGLDLRIEHFHGFSDHGDGGHYHCDTTPDEVEYLGYLNVAEYLYRIDRPKETHRFGRD